MSDKKGKKGGRKSASATGGDSADGEFKSNEKSKMDEVTIEIYEAKVRDLVEKLERYKHKCEILTIENDTLGKAQSKTSNDKQDIVEFLNIKVTEHEKQISTLEDTVAQLNAERAAMDQKAQQELENALKAAHHETESLQSQCAVLKAQLNDLNTFAGRKDELEQQLKSLKAQLETKERTYKETILSIERKVLQDKNAVKKEMLQKVNEAVANFRRVADQQMAETTKRAIRENMAISSQLKKMSTKTLELIAENDTLKQKVAQLRTGNGLLNESEQELAKKNQTNQRVIRMLVEKLKESDKMLEIAYESGLLDVDGNVMYEDGEDQQQRPILLEESIAGAAYEQQLPREPDASVAGTEDVEESNGAQHPGNEMGHARSSVHFEDEHGHTSRARSVGEEEIEPIPTHMSAVVEAPENHLDYSPLSDLVLKLSSIADELIKSWDQTTPEEYGAALANHVDRLRVILEDVASMPAEQVIYYIGHGNQQRFH
ncbi:hypothetical protein DFS34DRAFT_619985 [Phlyctochytrium arcticum]|nr:hypothetical protein DFS34DRAFT_619985 [Phlyctochytrium arcticum]